jgi:GT2 family glycosyltransferase
MAPDQSRALPNVAIVVVTWNSASDIGGFLQALQATDYLGPWRTVVVDNASSDSTLEIVRAIAPDASIVQTGRNAGYAAGANAGIRSAPEADAVLLLNPDLRVEPDTISELVSELLSSRSGIAVPQILDGEGVVRMSLRREPTVLRAWGDAVLGGRIAGRFPALSERESRVDVYRLDGSADWATGAAMLMSRECLDEVGAWDESYFLYSEETDFALRARDAGFPLRYTPRARVVHFEGESNESPALYSLQALNRVRFFRSRHGRVRAVLFGLGVLLGEALRAGGAVHRAAVRTLLGQRDGIARPT